MHVFEIIIYGNIFVIIPLHFYTNIGKNLLCSTKCRPCDVGVPCEEPHEMWRGDFRRAASYALVHLTKETVNSSRTCKDIFIFAVPSPQVYIEYALPAPPVTVQNYLIPYSGRYSIGCHGRPAVLQSSGPGWGICLSRCESRR